MSFFNNQFKQDGNIKLKTASLIERTLKEENALKVLFVGEQKDIDWLSKIAEGGLNVSASKKKERHFFENIEGPI